MLTEHQDSGDTWTYENLNDFLTLAQGFAPGTKMTFAGVKDDAERANIIAYPVDAFGLAQAVPAAEATGDGTGEPLLERSRRVERSPVGARDVDRRASSAPQ